MVYGGCMDEDLVCRLEQKAEHHAREAERYRVAAEVLRAEMPGSRRSGKRGPDRERGGRTPADPRHSTMAMVERALNGSGRPLKAQELVEEMRRLDWQTEAANPVNTARTAAHRLVDQERIQRSPDGRFGRLGLPVDGESSEDRESAAGARRVSADSASEPGSPVDAAIEEPPF